MDELIFYNAKGNPEDKKHLTAFAYLSSLHTTKTYHQYRQCPSNPNASVNLSIGNGSHLLVALPEKPILQVYINGKESPEQFIPLPEILTSLEIYNSNLLLGGSISGRLYIWSLNSGLLLSAKQFHYQPLTHITTFSGFIATGSKDSRIVIHSINSLFNSNSNDKPLAILNDHTLPITSLNFTKSLNNDIKLISSSLDSTVRIYSLSNINKIDLITTIIASNPITSLTFDPAFRSLYLGLDNGIIRSVALYKVNPKTKIIENVGGLGKIITLKPDTDLHETFTCHKDNLNNVNDLKITNLKISFDGTLLISGDSHGSLFIIDITTKQIRKKMKNLVGEITNIELFPISIDDKRFESSSNNNTKLLMRTIPVLKRSIMEEKDLANQKFTMNLNSITGNCSSNNESNLNLGSNLVFNEWLNKVQEEEEVFLNFSSVDSEQINSRGNNNTGVSFNVDKNAIKDLKTELADKEAAYTELKEKYNLLLAEYTSSVSK